VNIYFNFLFVLILVVFSLTKNYRGSVFLSVLSLLCDRFFIDIGVNLTLIYLVVFLDFILRPVILLDFLKKGVFNFIFYELLLFVILGILFGFVFTWEDTSGLRSWSQTSQGRSIVTVVRFFGDLLIVYYFYDLISNRKLSFQYILYCVALVSCLSFWIGFIDYFFSYSLHDILFAEKHLELGRFLGLNGEPKALGRNAAWSFFVILGYVLFYKSKNFFFIFALLTNFFAVLLSLSASSFILFLLMLLMNFFFLFIRRPWLILVLIPIFFAISIIDLNEAGTQDKITKALTGDDTIWIDGELSWFTRFDIFDRLALIFLYLNPKYLLFGVGPNLISIPASEFIPSSSVFSEEGRIDSVPNVFVINYIASSGIFGLSIFLHGLFRFYQKLKSHMDLKIVFLTSFLFFCIYVNPILFFALGISYGQFELRAKERALAL
jgi:hypothetical protein